MPFQKGNKLASYNNTERYTKKTYKQNILGRFRVKQAIVLYNKYRMNNKSEILTNEQLKNVGLAVQETTNNPVLLAKQLLKMYDVKDYANNALMLALSKKGINIDYGFYCNSIRCSNTQQSNIIISSIKVLP